MASGEGIGAFGDRRRAERGAWLFDRILATGSLVLRRVGGDRAGEMAVHRFLDAEEVTCAEIVDTLCARTAERAAGRRIVAVQDTTEINFCGRERSRRGLGPAGDGASAGFFLHPLIAVDAQDEAVIGLLDAAIWTRGAARPTPRRQRPLAEKESRRWLDGARAAAARCQAARETVVVGDRESDIYALFAERPQGVELLVRAAQDRAIEEGGRLFAQAAAWPILGAASVALAPKRPGDPGRTARVELRAGRVRLRRPHIGLAEDWPPQLEVTLVEAREAAPPPGAAPLHWRLLTTLAGTSAAAAAEIVRLYRLRWRIEQTFRALKSDGLKLPEVQLHAAARLFKLAAIALGAAVRTIQLVDARDGGPRPASDVADAAMIEAAAAIGPTLERKTARQQNPHPKASLAWLAWIIARLGGWNCYYKPPGPKTMRAGWDRFAAMAAGYHVAKLLTPSPLHAVV